MVQREGAGWRVDLIVLARPPWSRSDLAELGTKIANGARKSLDADPGSRWWLGIERAEWGTGTAAPERTQYDLWHSFHNEGHFDAEIIGSVHIALVRQSP